MVTSSYPSPDLSPPTHQRDRILAAIDVGTNSIHMVLVHVQPSLPTFTIIGREKSTVRLGDRDLKTGDLTPAAMKRAITALRRCKEIAQAANAEEIIAVATSAMREAPNGRDFLQQIESDLGLVINLISGPEEARRIYLGVLSSMTLDTTPHVLIDIGGGSTELVLGDGHAPRSLSSTKVGAVRLTQRFVHSDPIDQNAFVALQSYIRGMLERAVDEIHSHRRPGETLKMIGTSGTIEILAELTARAKTGIVPSPLNGYEIARKDIDAWVQRLKQLDYAGRMAIPGMSERRAEILLAGALILHEAMEMLDIPSITICERSLREGVIVDWMLTNGLIEDRLRYQGSVRQRSVIKTAQKYHVNLDHSDRVAEFAVSLFDQTQGILHNWDNRDRDLIWAAAILHNAGHHISHSAHHKHSYYLVRHAELLGYTEIEIETIANIARYHRKSGPKKKHENYRNLTSKRYRKLVDQMHPLLRLAVALDRRHIGAIQAIKCEYHEAQKQLQLNLHRQHPNDPCELELWSLNLKKENFEQTYHVQLLPIIV
ncbi:Ppx/GppA family phosphatase [filamentous cyanobacterium LEGE 11480]|uniref:Ppx/GppA family phosphatase n=1 Tax=Romeriopsis navalis LEGE 11480 TaxID=2777977 RepID=A0A928Z3Z7_9CYAN|nr:Ppx/GppA phosphatase family protein [Romeriopsis navalis]MBE9032026.1 Ppx/GppA family phosphatase [Romeriopsis navalis LEGE 11480]